MAADSAIADVGETLVKMLQDRMDDLVDRNEIALASPTRVGDGDRLRLTLYLYRLTENADLKNSDRIVMNERQENPPLALDLHYLLTAHPATGGDDNTARSGEQHTVLGRAMQVLYDNAAVRGSDLSGSLAGDGEEEVRISMNPMDSGSFDQVMSMWSTFQEQPYQPSISYLVSPVLIESTASSRVQRVVEKNEHYYGNLGG